jgi:Protein of unknown function (DUF3300)
MEVVPKKLLSLALILLLALPWSPLGPTESAAQTFKPEEIEQIVAPIALYPDSLISQILMASTYPLEVVEAARWVRQNQNLKGDALAAALEKQSWDPSVKSLVNFPQVLATMSEKLDQTQKLGDVFLAQQKDVLDAIQRLRARAQETGNLKTTQEQKVIVEEKVIKIEPANPQVVYVPTYNPTVVYGAWPYPAYPPTPWYPPGYVATSMFSFAAGVAVGAAWGYAWGGCNWGRGDVDIDINRNTNINNTHINREQYKQNFQARGQREGGSFQHDPSHRKGVGYRDNATAQKFNRGANAQQIQARENFRGRAESGRQELARQGGVGDRGGLGEKGGLGDRGGLGDKGGVGDRGKVGDKGGLGDRGGLGDKGGLGEKGGVGDRGKLADKGGIGDRGGLGDKGGLGDRGGVADKGGGLASRSGGGSLGDRGGGVRQTSGGGSRGGGAFDGIGSGGQVRSASSRGAASRGGGGGVRAGGGHHGGGGGHRGGGGRRR